jgi:hypothetical protein
MVILGSWALVALVIAYRFLLDSHPFLLEVIGVSSLGLVPFKVHLKLFQEFFPLIATCLPSFEQLAQRGTYRFQEIISKIFHNQSFSNIISNMSFDSHHMHACDTPPSSLMDSIANPKVKTPGGEGVGARSLACNTLGVEGHAGASGWD